MSASIFLCYRRSDSPDAVDRIYERLEKDFSRQGVFRDIDSIPLGIDFRAYITQILEACSSVLVVIGPGWIDARDEHGRRRLDDPKDHVRQEIQIALSVKGLRIIPVFVRNASMPRPEELPDSIQGLAARNGQRIRPDPDFRGDMSRLVRHLSEEIEQRGAEHQRRMEHLRQVDEETKREEQLETGSRKAWYWYLWNSNLFRFTILFIIPGFIGATIAKLIMNIHLGFLVTTLLGIIGSLLGGLVARLFSKSPEGSWFPTMGFLPWLVTGRDFCQIWCD